MARPDALGPPLRGALSGRTLLGHVMRGRGLLPPPLLLALAVVLATVAGCRRTNPSDAAGTTVTTSSSAAATARPEESKLWNYPEERWDDPALQKEPRLQFVWRTPDEKRDSIFSVKLDGTDIRRVAGPSLLYSGEAKDLSQTPVRSPDRRYIACVGDDASGEQLRYLVDLKTRTTRTMMKTYGAAYFNWTPDSRHVMFYGDIKLWQYDLDTGTVTRLPMIYSRGLYLVDEGRRFIAIRQHAIEQYDRSGKVLKKTSLSFEPGDGQSVSGDGRLAAFALGDKSVVVSTERAEKTLFEGRQSLFFSAFAPNAASVYFFGSNNDLTVLELAPGKLSSLTRLPGVFAGNMTMVGAVGIP